MERPATKTELECLRILLLAGMVDLRAGDLGSLAIQAGNVVIDMAKSIASERAETIKQTGQQEDG